MIDHVGFAVRDYGRSKAFYEKVLAPLGLRLLVEPSGAAAGFGADEKPTFWIEAQGRPVTGRLHIAIGVDRRDQVDEFHAVALEAGAKDNGRPRVRAMYHPDYYSAYVLDPDGNNIEAVCHAGGKCRGGAVRCRVVA